MAISFHCDYCGEALYRDHDWVKFSAVERGSGATGAEALNRMGLNRLDDRIKDAFHFHLKCFERALGMIDNHRRWAQGDDGADGLKWELVEQVDHPWQRRRSAVLSPMYRNRILALCREKGIDRDQLAEELGTSRGAVGRWLKCYAEENGRVVGIRAKWLKRLQMFFDLDSRDHLFEHEPTGDAPAEEFVRAY